MTISLFIIQVYKGYVDDPRNTDNAWMETVAMNFHDEDGSGFGSFTLEVRTPSLMELKKMCYQVKGFVCYHVVKGLLNRSSIWYIIDLCDL